MITCHVAKLVAPSFSRTWLLWCDYGVEQVYCLPWFCVCCACHAACHGCVFASRAAAWRSSISRLCCSSCSCRCRSCSLRASASSRRLSSAWIIAARVLGVSSSPPPLPRCWRWVRLRCLTERRLKYFLLLLLRLRFKYIVMLWKIHILYFIKFYVKCIKIDLNLFKL